MRMFTPLGWELVAWLPLFRDIKESDRENLKPENSNIFKYIPLQVNDGGRYDERVDRYI